MTGEEYRQEQQKIYDDLINTVIRFHVKDTEFDGNYATVHYANKSYVTVSESSHMFSMATNGGRSFFSEKMKLDKDFHDFVWETAKLDRERKDALQKVERELVARKDRAKGIEKLKKFAEDFKNALYDT